MSYKNRAYSICLCRVIQRLQHNSINRWTRICTEGASNGKYIQTFAHLYLMLQN